MATQPAALPFEPVPRLKVPRHMGVIMDGNGRWAEQRGLARSEGHMAGVEAVRRLVSLSIDYGIQYLTVFSFSAENWRRPLEEVRFLFGLLHRFIASDLEKLSARNVRIRIIGTRDDLDRSLCALLADAEKRTQDNNGLTLIIAFNYGAKVEIANAMRTLARKVASGQLSPDDIDESLIARHLETSGLPDPDLIVRTSGEMRLSNFLLWQSAYAELVFVEENWPDFDEQVFIRALSTFTSRDRRFGGIGT